MRKLVLACLMLASCGNSEPPPPFQQPGVPAAAPLPPVLVWSVVTEKSTCEAMPAASCPGFYGFSVDSSGHYVAGPAPGGVSRTGSITDTELEALYQDAAAVASSGITSSAACAASAAGVPGVSDSVLLTTTGGSSFEVYRLEGAPGQLCTRGSATAAEGLDADLRALVSSYYPVPFT